jgi:hypothetical protein
MLHKQRIVAASILRCDAGHTHDGHGVAEIRGPRGESENQYLGAGGRRLPRPRVRWQKGLGKFAKDGPKNGPQVTNGPGDDPEAPYKDINRELARDYPVRGTREGFS